MQLVLLSGGSGQRLWPLSNSQRSKQFLPLLEREDGSRESMIQRVVRQASAAGLAADGITIATGQAQADILLNQLGEDKVDLVFEPERRDTFPAIALATCHLSLVKGCGDDEPVVVMPCDPYTDDGYFRTIGKMVDCLQKGAADLILMGITPDCPSTRYGYIVPRPSDLLSEEYGALSVESFTEKPNEAKAIDLLYRHALWNGGVFTFKLGYLMDVVRKYTQETDFAEILRKYSLFPKISFDYEVVEKAGSVAVVPFTGRWKDLGTWNSLTAELGSRTIGSATIANNCSNVHVINELPNHIFVNGISDAVVAASPDGILVSSKSASEDIKARVKTFTGHPMYQEYRWGSRRVIDIAPDSLGMYTVISRVDVYAGMSIPMHKHRDNSELWTIMDGSCEVRIGRHVCHAGPGMSFDICADTVHSLRALTNVRLIEVHRCVDFYSKDKEWIW